MREMYAMDVGRGMGVAGRIVAQTIVTMIPPLRCEIRWDDGTSTVCHPHDRLDVDEDTPQRVERVETFDELFRRHYPDLDAAGLLTDPEPG